MYYRALSEFLHVLEKNGELRRIQHPVDPYLEITEIATRAVREGKPALILERVKGSNYPLAINVYGSEKRIELALGKHPEQLGEELLSFLERMNPPTLKSVWRERRMLQRLFVLRPYVTRSAVAQEVCVTTPNLKELPLQWCWPNDGGRFITQGQVVTYHPHTQRRNIGVYRMQVYDEQTTGMHWQIQKGGGFHYAKAEERNQPLEVAVALGTCPALYLASVAALPEDIDEVLFASFLQNRRVPFTHAKTLSLLVPADAEFILEGVIYPKERRLEGPFGDHFGHYSIAAEFPVFHVKAITHRKHPVYPATVVGIPPMEDKYLGDATQQILSPIIKVLYHEIRHLWAYYEAGFHNLLVAAVDVRYKKEALKTSFALLGTGQLSLTKCLILVSREIDPRNWRAVLREIRDNVSPESDVLILPNVPLDTLDFTSGTMELGSKMIIDATRKAYRAPISRNRTTLQNIEKFVQEHDPQILRARLFEDCLLVVQCERNGRTILEKLIARPELQHCTVVAAVSPDVDIESDESVVWGIFTRFDCMRDVFFQQTELKGNIPIYHGVIGIDATWKEGYPEPLKMDPAIVRKVDEYWDTIWKNH